MLQSNKATKNTDITTKFIKNNADFFAEFVFISLNKWIEQSVFQSKLKLANITAAHKKTRKAQNTITDPPVFCQIVLKYMRQSCLNKCLNISNLFLSKYQCGFRKRFSVQHCLLSMLEKWESAIDNKTILGALLTDPSKAFYCLSQDLLIAKLKAYGFSIAALRLVKKLSVKSPTKVQNKLWFQLLGGNIIWGTSGIHIRTFIIQHFSVVSFFS